MPHAHTARQWLTQNVSRLWLRASKICTKF
jgi:hypothetical protein